MENIKNKCRHITLLMNRRMVFGFCVRDSIINNDLSHNLDFDCLTPKIVHIDDIFHNMCHSLLTETDASVSQSDVFTVILVEIIEIAFAWC